jgi:hypothetical protein
MGCYDIWFKNISATYQRVMNLIFHNLLGIILEIYIERMCRYGMKMNSLKYVFDVSGGKLLGFIIHEHGIEIDPKKIDSMQKVQPLQSKNDMQKFLGKLNYLRRFISNLSWKISVFVTILRLKNEADFTWGGGAEQQLTFDEIKKYLFSPSVMKAPKVGILF